MIDLMGDAELDLLVLPVVVTTLVLGQVIEASANWFTRHVPLTSSSAA